MADPPHSPDKPIQTLKHRLEFQTTANGNGDVQFWFRRHKLNDAHIYERLCRRNENIYRQVFCFGGG